MTKKAIAYTSDIILGKTGEVIVRAEQQLSIRRYAKENDIDIVAWFEDELYAEDLARRPGIKRLLECPEPWEFVLVERIWSLSRSWKKVKWFLDALDSRGKRLESAAWLWDCVSVLSRHHGRHTGPCAEEAWAREPACAVNARQEAPKAAKPAPRISRPIRLNFINLVNQGKPA